MIVICPHCNTEYPDTPDEYQGMSCDCAVCQKEFIMKKAKFCSACGTANAAQAKICNNCGKSLRPVPTFVSRTESAPVFQPPSEENYAQPVKRAKKHKPKNEQSNSSGSWLKTLGGIILVVGFFVLKVFVFGSSEVSASQLAKEVKEHAEKSYFNNHLYQGSAIKDVTLQSSNSSPSGRFYRGEMVFERAGHTYRRPLVVFLEKQGESSQFFYSLDFSYSDKPEFLKEDADIFFKDLAGKIDQLRSFQFVSAEIISSNVVRCIAQSRIDSSRQQVDIRVNQLPGPIGKIGVPQYRITWEMIDAKEL